MMIDNKTGFLVKEGNYNNIIEKLSKLLENERLSKEMGKEGAKFIRDRFNWELVTKNFLDTIRPHLKT